MQNKLKELIGHFGSQAALARVLNVSRVAVTYWCAEGQLPPLRAVQIEVLTKGVFKAVDLCEGKADEE